MANLPVTNDLGWPVYPRSEVYPGLEVGVFAGNVAAGGSCIFPMGIYGVTTSEDWTILYKPMASWTIHTSLAAGAILNINLTPTDAATAGMPAIWTHWKSFPLYGSTRLNFMYGLYLPGWKCQFALVNNNPGVINFITGMIKVQGVH